MGFVDSFDWHHDCSASKVIRNEKQLLIAMRFKISKRKASRNEKAPACEGIDLPCFLRILADSVCAGDLRTGESSKAQAGSAAGETTRAETGKAEQRLSPIVSESVGVQRLA